MELREFITESIKQIIDAVEEAQEYSKTKKVRVSPPTLYDTKHPGTVDPQKIEFDVAVTTALKEADEAGGGIKVFEVFNIGGKIKSEDLDQTVSRIRFHVGISFKEQKYKDVGR